MAARKPGLKAPYPGFVEPALATSIEKVPSGERWVHAIKFDGYRVQVHVRDAAVKVFTRRGNDWSNRFRKIASDAWDISSGSVIIDGEIVVPAADGTTDSVEEIRRLCSLWHRSPSDNILEFVVQTLRLGP